MKTVSIKHTYWDIAADIYFPDDFNSEKKYPAIISAHPIGSCKEQTSGSVYGAALAKFSGKQRWRTALSGRSNNASKRLQHCR